MGRAALMALMMTGVLASCERREDTPPEQPAGGPAPAPQAAGAASDTIQVTLMNREGQQAGTVRLVHQENGAILSVRAEGLTPNQQHGIHVHETGRCDPPSFESAGGHFAPFGRQHGLENPQGPHAGDLPNLHANAQGVADTTLSTPNLRVAAGAQESLMRPGGLAIVVHAGPDDQRTDPSGNSGDRLLCGVIAGT